MDFGHKGMCSNPSVAVPMNNLMRNTSGVCQEIPGRGCQAEAAIFVLISIPFPLDPPSVHVFRVEWHVLFLPQLRSFSPYNSLASPDAGSQSHQTVT